MAPRKPQPSATTTAAVASSSSSSAPATGSTTAEKLTGDAATTAVFDYLVEQNRPYSATDISANLHNRVSKAAATKALRELHEHGRIVGRAAGKQIVYHRLQATEPVGADELAALDSAIREERERLEELRREERGLRAQIVARGEERGVRELVEGVRGLRGEKEGLEERVRELRKRGGGGEAPRVEVRERERVREELRVWSNRERVRERIAREMWGEIEERGREAGMSGVVLGVLREGFGLDDLMGVGDGVVKDGEGEGEEC